MNKDELIAQKVRELEALMADDTQYESNDSKSNSRYIIEESEWNKCPVDVLKAIMDVNIAKMIMKRVDEMYGVKHSNEYQKPLYEEYQNILKSLNE